jgi:hypothetical protein
MCHYLGYCYWDFTVDNCGLWISSYPCRYV